ncbi:MAG TPA: hypothetical protein VN493_25710 [Thermoanaerobaculia bacterium]|nr:hypothetical protein [Thermoanaerobaculia bacterium]
MHRPKLLSGLLFVLALSLLWAPAQAATVLQMNLEEMVDRADRIFRGTVLDIREGTVQAGGGTLPTVTYRIQVDESFKGTYDTVKGIQVAELTMVGKLKNTQTGATRSLPPIDLPKLEVGRDYLLLTTPRSAVGLSTPVGLGQGTFHVTGKAGQELAVNLNQNLGLLEGVPGAPVGFAGTPENGPIAYDTLASIIRGLVD